MHTSIRTPCSIYYGLLMRDAGNCCFHNSLHCWPMTIGLALKAMIIGTIIFDTTRNIHCFNVDRDAKPLHLIVFSPFRPRRQEILRFTQDDISCMRVRRSFVLLGMTFIIRGLSGPCLPHRLYVYPILLCVYSHQDDLHSAALVLRTSS